MAKESGKDGRKEEGEEKMARKDGAEDREEGGRKMKKRKKYTHTHMHRERERERKRERERENIE